MAGGLITGAVLKGFGALVDKLFPDPAEAQRVKQELAVLEQQGYFKELDSMKEVDLAQARVNELDSQSTRFWNSGWRPGAGWMCLLALFVEYVVSPLLPWVVQVIAIIVAEKPPTIPPIPQLDTAGLMTLLMGLLGIGTLRTIERVKGRIP